MKEIVFALPGNEILATHISNFINAESGQMIIRNFPDGETYVRVLSKVKNKKIILVCTLVYPDQKLLPLFFLSKTLKDLGAASITLVAPYLAYMRQDTNFKPGEGITSNYFATLISGFADKLITIDPHLHRYHSMSEIYSIPCTVIHAASLISDYIKDKITDPILIGPDSESEQWVSQIAKAANVPFIILEKTRLGDHEVKISAPDLDRFKGHSPVLVDDIISTAETMIQTIGHLKKSGMKPPVCIAVHGIFTGNSYRDLIQIGAEKIVTTDTIPHESNQLNIGSLIVQNL